MEKNFFMKCVKSILMILIILGMIGFYVDSWQQIRYNSKWHRGEERILISGLVKNYNYETVVIGTSTSQNILKKDVDNIFNTNSINLCLSGSTALEHRNLLNVIIKNNDAKTVIYGIDNFSYNNTGVRKENIDYTKKENILKYLFNINLLKDNIKVLKREITKKNQRNWIYKLGFWGDDYTNSEENTLCFDPNTQFGGQNLGIIKGSKEGYNLEIMKENFDEFLKIVNENKNIEYIIYLPPYAILYWYALDRYNSLENVLEFKKHIYEKTKDLKNISIYDFQDREDIIDNLNNYKDAVHYGPFINKKIIEEINKTKPSSYNSDFEKNIKRLIEKNREKFEEVYRKYNID